jgi:hypothetical protein
MNDQLETTYHLTIMTQSSITASCFIILDDLYAVETIVQYRAWIPPGLMKAAQITG